MNVKRVHKILLVFIALGTVLLQGCSYLSGDDGMFRAREKDYLKAATVEPMEIPEGLKTASLESQFKVPAVDAQDEFGDPVELMELIIPRPDPVSEDDEELGVKIQSLDEQRWIFLNVSTAQVWPQTQSFLSQSNVYPVHSVPAQGLVETDWVTFKDSPDKRSRYRVFIEKGVHPDTTEVHALHVEYPKDSLPSFGESFEWPDRSHSAVREAWLLDEMAVVLSQGVKNSAASLMGQHVGGQPKVKLGRYDDEPAIYFRLSSARAKASVSHAVQAETFIQYDSIGEYGVFHFGYPYDKNANKGFWNKIAVWSDGNSIPATSAYSLETILSHISDSPDATRVLSHVPLAQPGPELKGLGGYFIVLKPSSDGMVAVVRNARAERLPAGEAKKILKLLRTRLI